MPVEDRRWAWQRLRLLRASRPGLASESKPRAELVSASLEQCEQLMTAALNVGTAARPLPLFYALSQATRAICAVRLKEHFILRRHGLSWPEASQATTPLMHREISPEPRTDGAFTRLCAALRCDDLSRPVAVGAVWRALPDLAGPDLPTREPSWFNAMEIGELPGENRVTEDREWMELFAGPCDDSTLNAAEWTQRLKRYPSLAGWSPTPFATAPGEATYAKLGNPPATVVVLRQSVAETSTQAEAWMHIAFCGEPYGGSGHRFAVPALPSGDILRPLALWWAVLFALSNLARYEPDRWLRALNVDRNPLAVTPEFRS